MKPFPTLAGVLIGIASLLLGGVATAVVGVVVLTPLSAFMLWLHRG